jgi:hypothetical protein
MTEENNEILKMHVSRTILEGKISRICRNAVGPEIKLQVMQTPVLDVSGMFSLEEHVSLYELSRIWSAHEAEDKNQSAIMLKSPSTCSVSLLFELLELSPCFLNQSIRENKVFTVEPDSDFRY